MNTAAVAVETPESIHGQLRLLWIFFFITAGIALLGLFFSLYRASPPIAPAASVATAQSGAKLLSVDETAGDKWSERVEVLERSVAELTERVSRLPDVNGMYANANQRFKALESADQTFAGQLSSYSATVGNLTSRVDEVEADTKRQNPQATALQAASEAVLRAEIAGLQNAVKSLGTRLDESTTHFETGKLSSANVSIANAGVTNGVLGIAEGGGGLFSLNWKSGKELVYIGPAQKDGAKIVLRSPDQNRTVVMLANNNDVAVATCLNGTCTIVRSGQDIAEWTPADKELQPGMVASMSRHGAPVATASRRPFDTTVLGIVSGAGALEPAIVLGKREDVAGVPIALSGTVYVKADADFGPIAVGDLLTTSAVAGHVMHASRDPVPAGTVVAKALEPLEKGRALIRAWVITR